MLYCWFYTIDNLPKGVPLSLETAFCEEFNVKKPFQDFDFEWVKYNYYNMPFPPEKEELKLPKKIYLVVKNIDEPLFDFFNVRGEYKIFSKQFYKFLLDNGLNENYELSNLLVIDKKGKVIGNKEYILLRFAKFDDDLFDFDSNSKVEVDAIGMGDTYLYPNLKLKEQSNKKVFVLDNFCYKNVLIFNDEIKTEIMSKFYFPEVYNISDFPEIYNQELGGW